MALFYQETVTKVLALFSHSGPLPNSPLQSSRTLWHPSIEDINIILPFPDFATDSERSGRNLT